MNTINSLADETRFAANKYEHRFLLFRVSENKNKNKK
jgi:hypothetical protein